VGAGAEHQVIEPILGGNGRGHHAFSHPIVATQVDVRNCSRMSTTPRARPLHQLGHGWARGRPGLTCPASTYRRSKLIRNPQAAMMTMKGPVS
jgi:hypothetical protein